MVMVAMIIWSSTSCCYTVDDQGIALVMTGDNDSNHRDDKDKDGQWSWPLDNL